METGAGSDQGNEMMRFELAAARDLAVRLAIHAGGLASTRFGRQVHVSAKGSRGDLVTEVDVPSPHRSGTTNSESSVVPRCMVATRQLANCPDPLWPPQLAGLLRDVAACGPPRQRELGYTR